MDEELYQTFITESEENITQLNSSFLSLESNPNDTETIDDVLRQTHTPKRNFGAMSFNDAVTTAHAVENLLDEVRHERLDVTVERTDLVFDEMDLIVSILHDTEENGESTIDSSNTVEEIHAAVEDGGNAENSNPTASNEADRGPVDLGSLTADCVDIDALDATTLTHARIELDAGQMKSVDAGIFLGSISEDLGVVGASPSRNTIEDGEFGDGFDLFVTERDAAVVGSELDGLWKVSVVETTDVFDALAAGDATATASDASVANSDADAERDASALGETESSADTDADTVSDTGADAAIGEQAGDDGSEGDVNGAEPTDGDDTDDADDAGNVGGMDDADEGDGAKQRKEAHSISMVKSVHMDVDQLDELHELVEQLITSRVELRSAIDAGQVTVFDTLDELDKISSNLQNTVMDMRLIPLKKVFNKFPRLVRDLTREQDKRVSSKVEGADIELDRTTLDKILDLLVHVPRNTVDHGIEDPDAREASGKSRTGTVRLSACRQHDTVIVTVEDDGNGIDTGAIREKAIDKGIATHKELDQMPGSEVYGYILHPGLSTNDEIADMSDRGAGVGVVKTTIESLDDSALVESDPGEGSTFNIRLPMSVAIIKVLFVQVENREPGVPVKYIDEISRRDHVQTVNGTEVIIHEETIFPLIRLHETLKVDSPEPDDGTVARIRPDDKQVALHCDGVTKQGEVAMTPLQGPLSDVGGLSGIAVISGGNVIPILGVSTFQLPAGGEQAVHEFDPSQLPDAAKEAID